MYFTNVNIFLPLLHRPNFEKDLEQKLHMTNRGFAKIVLLVCAVGARYATADSDPRLCASDPDRAGEQWFNQVQLTEHLTQEYVTLYDIQAYCVCGESIFLLKYSCLAIDSLPLNS
jgi:hypothetical protein